MFVEMMLSFHKSERIPVEKGGKKILIGIDKIRFVMAATTTLTCRPILTATSPQ